ncbi:DUF7619 domain-containing protein [Flavobacterium terrae]|uniref:Conserved repeat domain-containing protein/Por secretion system C-terminal sorting domain-containing protein n=1 Tax=Flavobacterium terrae TaxID=415425 RepID=A0A1M6GZM3_9FLAO|nr:T9SS type A sorting domain-containing protein [Flavobacterium terrae]SHJ15370.1 conserved repeat domain-containing protein/Por secretion system C-terminal sorting domain-containing protein [Flavobacterium terrae]
MKKIYFLVLALCLFASANAQIINFPDPNFKAKLIALGHDTDSDGEISQEEAFNTYSLDISSSYISDLTGLNYFLNLDNFICNNNPINSINLSGFQNLSSIECNNNNNLTSVIVANNPNLLGMNFYGNNQLISLTVSNLPQLVNFTCSNNQLTSLALSSLPRLSELYCSNNQLESLTLNNLQELTHLYCQNNNLTSLDLSNLGSQLGIALTLWCQSNSLTTLNLSNVYLDELDCSNNLLTSIEIPDQNNIGILFCGDNPNLKSIIYKKPNGSLSFTPTSILEYICVAEDQIEDLSNYLNNNGFNNIVVNSYCSFTPGGLFYNIQGNSKFDENNNGCDASDVALSNLKFNITNGSIIESFIANVSGNYSIPVQAGTHAINPILENPNYFSITPSTVNVTFPTQTSPFTQNFCVTANGVHPDLEVTILPLSPARPGFDATYKLVYKNKGNTTQFGTVNVVFNDAVLDFVVANPVVTSQTVNNLSWNFTNLLPFETREITFTLNVNSPMETPAVNEGDVLNYTVTITSPETDDLPNDNTFVLNQTVVNSYDPNDKTCLEGATIPPSKVGDYVHYMIRFENNGTANAQNIVVKDMIDTNKFDINSLVPIKGSHSFVTNISAGNKVEFIFENINLPFDDANNDGYVAFKIKTKPTLTNGDTFSNSASIYFDYNFPIVTNTATTTIQALSRQDFEFSTYFKVYPNPVSTTLNIDAKDTIQISSINIYNTLGQLVLVVPNAQDVKTVDVSNLTLGNYFIKINSDKGTSNTKFIKQ